MWYTSNTSCFNCGTHNAICESSTPHLFQFCRREPGPIIFHVVQGFVGGEGGAIPSIGQASAALQLVEETRVVPVRGEAPGQILKLFHQMAVGHSEVQQIAFRVANLKHVENTCNFSNQTTFYIIQTVDATIFQRLNVQLTLNWVVAEKISRF